MPRIGRDAVADVRVEDSRKDGGALVVIAETDQPMTAAALLAAIRQALANAGVK